MFKLIGAGLALLVAVVLAPLLWMMAGDQVPHPPAEGLPWQIDTTPDGNSTVFGLTLGRSVLDDARPRFGPDVDIAIVAPPDRSPLLEAYYEDVTVGFITGKLILTADVDADAIDAMRERALKVAYMESVTRKITLHPDDLVRARATPIRVITFIPSAELDEEVILARFGPPARRVRKSDQLEHFLYPDKGLDIALSSRGRDVFQYVAPRDFALLSDPLLRAASDQQD